MALRTTVAGISSPEALAEALRAAMYLADDGIATAGYLALALGKPLLLEGAPGVGKTEAAKALSGILGRQLIRLQCFEGIDAAAALYEWNYPRQMLAIRQAKEDQSIDIYRDDFLIERPMLMALRRPDSTVLLIDEIDRSDHEFEAFLLEFLSDFSISIPERGTLRAAERPVVVLTSNRTRELSEALKRRCLHLQLGYPNKEVELEIVRLKAPQISEELSEELVKTIQELRTLDLRKAPSIGETLDWAQSLVVLSAPRLSKELIEETISVIAKYDRDAEKILTHLGVGIPERKDLGQKEPTGENPAEALYERRRRPGAHAH